MIERNQFGDHPSESPYDHIAVFIERCDTITTKDLSMVAVHMQLFPFSLKDKAKNPGSSPSPLVYIGLGKNWE